MASNELDHGFEQVQLKLQAIFVASLLPVAEGRRGRRQLSSRNRSNNWEKMIARRAGPGLNPHLQKCRLRRIIRQDCRFPQGAPPVLARWASAMGLLRKQAGGRAAL